MSASGRRCVVVTISRKPTLLVIPPQVGRRPRSNAHNTTDSMYFESLLTLRRAVEVRRLTVISTSWAQPSQPLASIRSESHRHNLYMLGSLQDLLLDPCLHLLPISRTQKCVIMLPIEISPPIPPALPHLLERDHLTWWDKLIPQP